MATTHCSTGMTCGVSHGDAEDAVVDVRSLSSTLLRYCISYFICRKCSLSSRLSFAEAAHGRCSVFSGSTLSGAARELPTSRTHRPCGKVPPAWFKTSRSGVYSPSCFSILPTCGTLLDGCDREGFVLLRCSTVQYSTVL